MGAARWSALLLVAVTVLTFAPALDGEFLTWDDPLHITANPHLLPVSVESIGHFWRTPYRGEYVPLSYTFWAGEAWLSGDGADLRPALFHLGSLLLHLGCVLMVWKLLGRIVGHRGAALVGAMLFAVHPVQVESVAWISETRGLLATLLSLGALWWFLRYAETSVDHTGTSGRRSRSAMLVLSTALFALALLAKPAAVCVPLVAALLVWLVVGRLTRQVVVSLLPWFVLSIVAVVIAKSQQPDAITGFVAPWWSRPIVAADAIVFYWGQLLWPANLGPDYGRTPQSVLRGNWYVPVTTVAVSLIALGFVLKHTRTRAAGEDAENAIISSLPRSNIVGLAIFLAVLLPVLGFVSFGHQGISTVADRYLYLAMFGPVLITASLLARYWRPSVVVASLGTLSLLAVISAGQCRHWRDSESLFRHTLAVNPRSVVAHNTLGRLHQQRGEHTAAILHFHLALAVGDQAAMSHDNLGLVLMAERRPADAERHFRQAVALQPDHHRARNNLGVALAAQGKTREAAVQFDTVLVQVPGHVSARRNRQRLRDTAQ